MLVLLLAMPRPRRIFQSEFPYHVYNRTNNEEYLFDLKTTYPIFLKSLKLAAEKVEFQIHHFILMNNHFHLIGSTPKANLNEFMLTFQTLFSKELNIFYGRKNHVFDSRYGATVVKDERYLNNLIKYVYQNSVRAQIVNKADDYLYSSLLLYLNDSWSEYGLHLDPYLENFIREQDKLKEHLKELCEVNLDSNTIKFIKKDLRKNEIA
ncbi:MAG: transposase [Deltaproteobacteria bacterium]|nr:transposase [Deltaproteobacteria bacterium]